MPSHFQTYAANFNRLRLSQMLDNHEFQGRLSRSKASLIVNPLTGSFYAGPAPRATVSRDETQA